MNHVIAGLSGFLMKIYDDTVDNPEVYSNLYDNKLALEILMVVCVVYFAHLDPIVMIACLFTVLTDMFIYLYNANYPVLNINYAIDKPVWIIGIILVGLLFIYKGGAIFENFQTTDYFIVMFGFLFILLDAISLISTKKEIIGDAYANMIHLEASNRKLILRIIALFGSILGAILIQFSNPFYEYFHILEYIFTWAIAYFLTSSMSILYLQHEYKKENISSAVKRRLGMTRKIDKDEDSFNHLDATPYHNSDK